MMTQEIKSESVQKFVESAVLAKKIYEIENSFYKKESEADKCCWQLTNSIKMELSEDHMMFYLWKQFPDQARSFFKAVPRMFYSVDKIEKMLKIQSWVCI